MGPNLPVPWILQAGALSSYPMGFFTPRSVGWNNAMKTYLFSAIYRGPMSLYLGASHLLNPQVSNESCIELGTASTRKVSQCADGRGKKMAAGYHHIYQVLVGSDDDGEDDDVDYDC